VIRASPVHGKVWIDGGAGIEVEFVERVRGGGNMSRW